MDNIIIRRAIESDIPALVDGLTAMVQAMEANKVDAVCENGVLTLTLPITEGAKPRQIPVKPVQRLVSKN